MKVPGVDGMIVCLCQGPDVAAVSFIGQRLYRTVLLSAICCGMCAVDMVAGAGESNPYCEELTRRHDAANQAQRCQKMYCLWMLVLAWTGCAWPCRSQEACRQRK